VTQLQEQNPHLDGLPLDAPLLVLLPPASVATPLKVIKMPPPLGRSDATKCTPGKKDLLLTREQAPMILKQSYEIGSLWLFTHCTSMLFVTQMASQGNLNQQVKAARKSHRFLQLPMSVRTSFDQAC
jgi:hypothetical protein